MVLFRYQSVGKVTNQWIEKSYLAMLAQDRLDPLMIPPILILEADTHQISVVQSKTIKTIKLSLTLLKSYYVTLQIFGIVILILKLILR